MSETHPPMSDEEVKVWAVTWWTEVQATVYVRGTRQQADDYDARRVLNELPAFANGVMLSPGEWEPDYEAAYDIVREADAGTLRFAQVVDLGSE